MMALFQEENFKVCCSLGVGALLLHTAILNTKRGPCVIDRSIMRNDWKLLSKQDTIKLRSANEIALRVAGVLPLKLRPGGLSRSVKFDVVDGLAEPITVFIAFYEKSIDVIFPDKIFYSQSIVARSSSCKNPIHTTTPAPSITTRS